MQEKRKYTRLKYPRGDRPDIMIKGRAYKVVDLSQEGLKFNYPGKPRKGEVLEAPLILGDRGQIKVKGKVVRSVGDLVMIQFDKLIDKKILAKEADYLLRRYGSIAI